MKINKKEKQKGIKGITLIALVITIIVLLILAGISISMLSGENSILNQATTASTKTMHSNVLEKIQIEVSGYNIDKTLGTYSNSLIDYLKEKSIISDIAGEENKWLINVEILLGSNQLMGQGAYPHDVYVLEKQDISTGSISNIKIASTEPIKIAQTSRTKETYKVIYYGNTASENIVLGNINDVITGNNSSDFEKIYAYFYGKSFGEFKNANSYKDNTTLGILGSEIIELGYKSMVDNIYVFIQYNNNIYVYVYYFMNTDCVIDVTETNLDKNTGGEFEYEYGSDNFNLLLTPITENNPILIHFDYQGSDLFNLPGTEPFTGYYSNHRYYDINGVFICGDPE